MDQCVASVVQQRKWLCCNVVTLTRLLCYWESLNLASERHVEQARAAWFAEAESAGAGGVLKSNAAGWNASGQAGMRCCGQLNCSDPEGHDRAQHRSAKDFHSCVGAADEVRLRRGTGHRRSS
ncbi:hypothetical protein GCM10027597_04970 [Saccharopolyspora tripterygii]